jgi:hypothetical protein
MMTQMAPMLEMMKAKMGKRRFAMMMQTMGPMMSQMMEGGGGMGGGIPGGFGGGGGDIPQGLGMGGGDVTGDARRRWRRRVDGHDSAVDADGQFRRRRPPPASPAALMIRTTPGWSQALDRPVAPIASARR